MPALPDVPLRYPLRATDVAGLIAEIDQNLSAITRYLQSLREAIPLRVSVNGVALAGITDMNIVAGTGVHVTGAYSTSTSVLTLTITAP